MKAVDMAAKVITDNSFSWIDNLYLDFIPEDDLKTEDQAGNNVTDCLLIGADNSPDGWGNNRFRQLHKAVEIQLFYSLNFSLDTDQCEIALMTAFLNAGWIIDRQNEGQDPDTGQATKTIYVSKLENLGE
ncbi:putative phage tail protein [Oenococcus oeni]|uniref:DUF806 family protein n=1 Tax=Oenococcus oeni TaxID=1247 RepID=UPI00107D3965|nr:DUF806 family protein [Oenococcus oeni]AVI94106.1 hypothetical protein AX764_04335 [Oenococcus oeni]SYV99694.1 putative phage tail protein [Oenococcus oeni]SYW03872.1 putative phage tail protein [Oenococcus oeni]SYW17650.1 putative phage tail protein [Oenococcus oeni]VDC14625.1 putative phage tail protein [Oenococcus oeni]